MAFDVDEVEEFLRFSNDSHNTLHDKIYAAIKTDKLPLDKVSTVLNVNRALYNANLSMLTALSAMAGTNPVRFRDNTVTA